MPISLKDKVAIVTGGSRGIGRECCLALARKGCHIVIIAKSAKPKPGLPGSIYTVADEVRALGVRALPLQVDIRDDKKIDLAVQRIVQEFGSGNIHILVNNASALWWHTIAKTPMKKYDLITSINARGTFAMTRACLPHMAEGGFGRIITMSPPIVTAPHAYAGNSPSSCLALSCESVSQSRH
jgi:citronellol/citronellal dehydrogenase